MLTLGFPAGAEFHKAQVEKPNYMEVITDVLTDMTGVDLKVKCVVAESDDVRAAGGRRHAREDDEPTPTSSSHDVQGGAATRKRFPRKRLI